MGLTSDPSPPQSRLPDEDLVRFVLGGKHNLFALLVKRYEKALYHLGMRFSGNSHDAGDFVQEVFLKAYKNLSQFSGGKRGRFYSWLIKIAYNHGMGLKKKREYHVPLGSERGEGTLPSGDGPEEIRIKREMILEVQKGMRELSREQAVCLDCYFYLGLSYKEISDILDAPVNTVRSHIRRAKERMRKVLQGSTAEEFYEE